MKSKVSQFRRVAILNRGEPAVRFLRALKEYNLSRNTDIKGIAFYTEPDEGAPFVRLADEAVYIGPALVPGADGAMVSAYTHQDAMLKLLKETQCDAVWPGWGFLSEDPTWVSRLESSGICFIGPSSIAMERLGDKIASKHLAEAAEVPLAAWKTISTSDSEDTLLKAGEEVGYPLMVKASAGGGGRGIRKVNEPQQLLGAVTEVADEVRKSFGQGGIFIESCVLEARHIEVQFVAPYNVEAVALGVRDCSIQRRNQKVLEEAPSSVLSYEVEQKLCEATCRLAEAAEYYGVGTAEFLYHPETEKAFFLEVNSRLQVEHTVTEMITGCDLVAAQLDVARREPWSAGESAYRGHAIEVRLNAENAEQGFQPSPGLVRVFRPPSGPGVRVDSGVVEGMSIAPEFDSMIAKVICWGATRPLAIARLRRALQELQVVVEDGATNKGFLLTLLAHEAFTESSADTGWLDRAMEEDLFGSPSWEVEALQVAAILEYERNAHGEVQRFIAQTQNGIPQNLSRPEGIKVELRLRGASTSMFVFSLGHNSYLVGPEDNLQQIGFESTGAHSGVLLKAKRRHQVLYSHGRSGIAVEIDGAWHPVEHATGGAVNAPSPAMVVHVAVEEGDHVVQGDLLVTLEAMKMEMGVFSQETGTVRTVYCRPNQQVTAGQQLIELEPEEDASEDAVSGQVEFPEVDPGPMDRLIEKGVGFLDGQASAEEKDGAIKQLFNTIRSILLGYDVPSALTERVAVFLEDLVEQPILEEPGRWKPLVHLLGTFSSSEALFDRNLLPLADEAAAVSAELAFYDYCRRHHEGEDGAKAEVRPLLLEALAHYGIHSLEPSEELRYALWRLAVGHAHSDMRHRYCSLLLRIAMNLHIQGVSFQEEEEALKAAIERVSHLARPQFRFLSDNAREAAYVLFDQAHYIRRQEEMKEQLDSDLVALAGRKADDPELAACVLKHVRSPHSVLPLLIRRGQPTEDETAFVCNSIIQRLYLGHDCQLLQEPSGPGVCAAEYRVCSNDSTQQECETLSLVLSEASGLSEGLDFLRSQQGEGARVLHGMELILTGEVDDADFGDFVVRTIEHSALSTEGRSRLSVAWCNGRSGLRHRTFYPVDGAWREEALLRDIHAEAANRIELDRLSAFELSRIESPEQIYAFKAVSRANPRDERIFIIAEIEDVGAKVLSRWEDDHLWEFERAYFESLRVFREAQSQRDRRNRYHWNRLTFFVRSSFKMSGRDVAGFAKRFEAPTRGLGLEKVVIRVNLPSPEDEQLMRPTEFVVSMRGRHRLEVQTRAPSNEPLQAMTPYEMKLVRSRRMGLIYPYEIARMLQGEARSIAIPHPDIANGKFEEYDLEPGGEQLVAVDRPFGENTAGVVVGKVTNYTLKHPEGMTRVWIASDPTKAMGALAEPECRRINGALDLAEAEGLPVEWIPISAGAKIAMDSGTENLDWTASVLRRIVAFTQAGHEINVIVLGVNVGAQSYWNAEATMLMHTRGILIMTPEGSMVLTGKKALEYSGGVAAEDERGIGGFERIMGPNGQVQYFAQDMGEAYSILFDHYRYTYKRPGEPMPRLHPTQDPVDRSILEFPYEARHGEDFSTIGEIFDDKTNPGRKKPFAIRQVMGSVIDQDSGHLERFRTMRHGETAVIWDSHVGGHAVCLIGVESRPLPRHGRIPMDGPDTWTGGTLFPQSSKKVARAINGASGNRPVVVLANLSGFDGSPESLRKLQLEVGAEIGRAVVNFEGPLIFVVVGRYHGGAYVVFSKALNSNLVALALEGTYASVIGGAPAAAVVFPREVRRRAENDERVVEARVKLAGAPAPKKPALREALDRLYADVILEKRGALATEFDSIHSVQRAVEVGSLDGVIQPMLLRPEIVRQLNSWMEKQQK